MSTRREDAKALLARGAIRYVLETLRTETEASIKPVTWSVSEYLEGRISAEQLYINIIDYMESANGSDATRPGATGNGGGATQAAPSPVA